MKIFLLDSNGIICRYFFAMPEMFTENGINVNGLFGYCRFITDLIQQHKNENFAIVATFDRCSQNFRKEISATYKSNRKKADSSLIVQLNLAEEFCKSINIPVEFHINYEADDIIASISEHYQKDHEIFVVSPDKDLVQLVSSNVKVLNPFLKIIIDKDHVFEKFGVLPEHFHIFLALCGDSSDNITGIEGVGPKTALKIMAKTHNPIEMQRLFPKYDFSKFDQMLSLTKLCKEYNVEKISSYNIDISSINNGLLKYNFKSIKL